MFLNSNYLALLREKEMLIRKDHESTYSSSRTKFLSATESSKNDIKNVLSPL